MYVIYRINRSVLYVPKSEGEEKERTKVKSERDYARCEHKQNTLCL
jgi:hypothetical protein